MYIYIYTCMCIYIISNSSIYVHIYIYTYTHLSLYVSTHLRTSHIACTINALQEAAGAKHHLKAAKFDGGPIPLGDLVGMLTA